jgi:hypothetical protein
MVSTPFIHNGEIAPTLQDALSSSGFRRHYIPKYRHPFRYTQGQPAGDLSQGVRNPRNFTPRHESRLEFSSNWTYINQWYSIGGFPYEILTTATETPPTSRQSSSDTPTMEDLDARIQDDRL